MSLVRRAPVVRKRLAAQPLPTCAASSRFGSVLRATLAVRHNQTKGISEPAAEISVPMTARVSGTDLSAEVGTDLLAVRVQAELGGDLIGGPVPVCWTRILGRTGHADGFCLAVLSRLQPCLMVMVGAGARG